LDDERSRLDGWMDGYTGTKRFNGLMLFGFLSAAFAILSFSAKYFFSS
jgi:hypothetical protein